jgi:hypothetical protein
MEGRAMAKYMVLWEVDTSRTPEDPKTKKSQHLAAQEVVMKNLREGAIKEWGCFAGQWSGYLIFEGTAVELHTLVGTWIPFSKCRQVSEVISIDDVYKSTKALPE